MVFNNYVMKRIVVSIVVAFSFVSLYAQNQLTDFNKTLKEFDQAVLDSAYESYVKKNPELADNPLIKSMFSKEHLKFKGLEMDGPLDEFYKNLKKEISDLDGYILDFAGILKGTFAGTRGCIILIYPNSDNNIRDITVQFPVSDNWGMLKQDYEELCSNMVLKYGEPMATSNDYLEPFKEGDGKEIDGVLQGKVKLCQVFGLTNGYIQVCIITASSFDSVFPENATEGEKIAVSINYHDYKNNMVDTRAKYDDL